MPLCSCGCMVAPHTFTKYLNVALTCNFRESVSQNIFMFHSERFFNPHVLSPLFNKQYF